MSETSRQNDTLIELQRAFPDAVFDRRNVGKARDPRTGRVIRFGMPGQADVWGIIDGLHAEVEMKTDVGKQSKAQKNWQRAVERSGGIYIVARSPEDAIAQLREKLGSV